MKISEALLGGATFAFSRDPGIEPVKIDLSKYMGTWRVIACTDNSVEKKFADATETYTLAGVKHVDVVFKWRDESLTGPVKTYEFRGRILNHPSHGIWKMNLFPFFAVTYIVVEVAPDYSWAAVAHPSKKFGWLLARMPKVPEETTAHFRSLFANLGYDPAKFIKCPSDDSCKEQRVRICREVTGRRVPPHRYICTDVCLFFQQAGLSRIDRHLDHWHRHFIGRHARLFLLRRRHVAQGIHPEERLQGYG